MTPSREPPPQRRSRANAARISRALYSGINADLAEAAGSLRPAAAGEAEEAQAEIEAA
jgi:hypothetical protein